MRRGTQLYSIALTAPFRLDLTSAILRRFATPPALTEWIDGTFVSALPAPGGPVVAAITQPERTRLDVALTGPAAALDGAISHIHAMLGLSTDTTAFVAAARTIPWLHQLTQRFPDVRPARMRTLWEAGVTAIVFQSISMLAAGAVLDRFIEHFGVRTAYRGIELTLFPTCEAVRRTSALSLCATGMSRAKAAAIRALSDAVISGAWNEAELCSRSTSEVCKQFAQVRGIGPWSAAVIALRGLGRLDVFPLRDSGVIRTIDALSGGVPNATAHALDVLGSTRGMLYHYLLLARLDARGKIDAAPPTSTS